MFTLIWAKVFYSELKKKIIHEIEQPFTIGTCVIYLHISCGFARYPKDETDAKKTDKAGRYKNLYSKKCRT